jgi:pimeloyl-ACP methyl ester carboxylesterase
MKNRFYLVILLIFVTSNLAFAQPKIEEKNPILVIPGIMGSRLKNSETGKEVWVKFKKDKNDDLSLPMSPNLKSNRDKLVAFDLVNEVKILKFLPGISIYSDLLDTLEKKGGLVRGNWETPIADKDANQYYVYAYDWRQDNVENAQLLIRKIEKLRLKLGKPNLKFDVIGHSMGGLIARYAAMYGDDDLQTKPNPKWNGAKFFGKIFLLGTPNEGSMHSLRALNSGYSVSTFAGTFHPEIFSRDVAFSSPSLFQLLPHGKSARFYDEDLKPIIVDIYDPVNWKKYGWNLSTDSKIAASYSRAKKLQIDRYLEETLSRTKKFHDALDATTKPPASLQIYGFGSNCKETLDGAILFQDPKTKSWTTLTKNDSFKNSKGEKVDKKEIGPTIFADGDGTVSSRSFLAEILNKPDDKGTFLFNSLNSRFICEDHTVLPGNPEILSEIFAKLGIEVKDSAK